MVAALAAMTRFELILSALSRRLSATGLVVFLDLVLHAPEEDLFAAFPRPYATIGEEIGTVRSDASHADDEAIGRAAAELEAEGLVRRCNRLEMYGRLGPGTPYFWTLARTADIPEEPAWEWWQEAVELAAAFAPSLDRNATAVYLRLLPHLDAEGESVVSASGLGRAFAMHRATAGRCVQTLEEAGLLHTYPSEKQPGRIAVWFCIPANIAPPERDRSASEQARQLAKEEAARARRWASRVPFDRAEGTRLLDQVWGPYEQVAATIRLLGRCRGAAYSHQEIVELVLRPLIQLQHRYPADWGATALKQARTAALQTLAHGHQIENYGAYLAATIDAKLHQWGARTQTRGADD